MNQLSTSNGEGRDVTLQDDTKRTFYLVRGGVSQMYYRKLTTAWEAQACRSLTVEGAIREDAAQFASAVSAARTIGACFGPREALGFEVVQVDVVKPLPQRTVSAAEGAQKLGVCLYNPRMDTFFSEGTNGYRFHSTDISKALICLSPVAFLENEMREATNTRTCYALAGYEFTAIYLTASTPEYTVTVVR